MRKKQNCKSDWARVRLDSAVQTFSFAQCLILNARFMADSESEKSAALSMDGFLASVERRAYVIAVAACHDQQIALDIVQDSMFSMVKYYAKKPPEQWPALFFKVLNNRITDQHRKRGFGRLTRWFGNSPDENEQHNEAVDQLPTAVGEPDNFTDSTQLRGAMETALAQLSFKQQQALVLRLWQGLSVRETATAMGISEGSVKTHLSRAVHEMREHLQEYKPL